MRALAVLLMVATCGLPVVSGCGQGEATADGATVTVYVSSYLCEQAKAELATQGARVGEKRVRVRCLPDANRRDGLDLAALGAGARRVTEDSTAVAYAESAGVANRFVPPIVESAGIAITYTSSGQTRDEPNLPCDSPGRRLGLLSRGCGCRARRELSRERGEALIAVVVPTRDRSDSLRRCLAALRAQTVPVEIVIVDDGSVAQRDVAAVAQAAGALLVRRGGEGPAAARNAGARKADAAVVCFTDDDCEPAPGWVKALAAPILAGEAGSAAGMTVVGSAAGAADRAWQAIVGYLQQQAATPGSASPGFAPTANLACSRRLLAELPFDESFPAAAGEDRDWAERAARRGMQPRFMPAAVVVHRPGLSIRTFLRQQYGYGRGAARYREAGAGRRIGSPAFYAGLLRGGFDAGLGAGLLVCAAQVATAAGVVRERLGRGSG